MMLLGVVVIVVVVLQVALAKKFTFCDLAKEFRKNGIPNNQELNEWMCIVNHESYRVTQRINKYNSDGSHDHGLFQINDRYWCQHGKAGKGCNVKCADLVNDNISDDIKCAQHIKKVQGLKAWVGWNRYCEGKELPDFTKKCET